MDTPTYAGTFIAGGINQQILLAKGSALADSLITRQSGSLILTGYQADGTTAFDLTNLTGLDAKVKPYGSNETPVTLGTGTISGAGNNIYTVTWVKDKIPAGWSSYAQDRDGAIVLWVEFEETGTADYYQIGTRFNVEDGDFTGTGATTPVIGIIFYYNPTYQYDNTTTDADPTSGKYRMDSTTLASVTELYVSDTTQSGVDLQTYWQGLEVGSKIYVGNPNVKLEAAYFTVSGAPTNNTNYTTVPVTFVAAGTNQFTDSSMFSFNLDGGLANSFSDGSSLNDNNGNELLEFGVTASAVNHHKTTNAATGNDPVLSVEGETNVNNIIKGKGTGKGGFADGTDGTKRVLIDASGITTGTDRTCTVPDASGTIYLQGQQLKLSKGADVASAGALTLGTDGNYFDITGTTTITSIGTLGVGTVVTLHFDGILTLTHHATDLILPSGANITTAVGDEFTFVEYASGDWRCIGYALASGEAIVGGAGTFLPTTDSTDLTSAHTVVSGDINETHPIGSATSADFDITLDVSLLLSTSDQIGFKNESSYIARIVVSNTGTMTLNSQYTDMYLSPGQIVVFQGDTSTNAVFK